MSTCKKKKSEIARADNRSAFPNTAAIVDEFKKQFGSDQVKLIYAEEGGKTIGRKLPPAKNFLMVNQWLRMSEKLSLIKVRK
jgi:hypothetical protein